MAFDIMTEREMTDYLKDFKKTGDAILEKKRRILNTVETMEDAIQRNTFGGPNEEVTSFNNDFSSKDKNYKVLIRSYRDIEEEMKDILKRLWLLLEEKEKYEYVQHCLDRLPVLQEEIIKALYIDGMKWEDYGRLHYISHTTVARNRKRAMDNLLVLYNFKFSGKDNKEKDGGKNQ